MKTIENVGIQDGLTVTARKAECPRGVICQAHLVTQGVHGVRILKDGDLAYVLDGDEERAVVVHTGIDWDGKGLVLDPNAGKRIDLNKIRKVCPACGATIHSWRSDDGSVPQDGLPEGESL
jgi:hypothetical protein